MKLLHTRVARRLESTGLLFLAGLILITIFAVVEGPWDPVADWHRESGQLPAFLAIAHWISRWCDFWPGGLFFCLTLGAVGFALRSARLRRLAVLALCAAILAGSVSTVLKTVLGRARPYISAARHIDDGFHGPHFSSAYASFPSGHTTTAFAVAVTLAMLWPRARVPALLVATAIGWSRLYVGAHYLGDVLAGVWIGSYSGWVMAMAYLRRLERHPHLPHTEHRREAPESDSTAPVRLSKAP